MTVQSETEKQTSWCQWPLDRYIPRALKKKKRLVLVIAQATQPTGGQYEKGFSQHILRFSLKKNHGCVTELLCKSMYAQ